MRERCANTSLLAQSCRCGMVRADGTAAIALLCHGRARAEFYAGGCEAPCGATGAQPPGEAIGRGTGRRVAGAKQARCGTDAARDFVPPGGGADSSAERTRHGTRA